MLTVLPLRGAVLHDAVHDDPLSSGSMRYTLRAAPRDGDSSGAELRSLTLRHAVSVAQRVSRSHRYSDVLQVSVVDEDGGVPLITQAAKDWKTKAGSDGHDGDEEIYDWEEES